MVGIDVERVMDLRLESRILLAGRYFSQGEQDYLKSQPKDAQMIAFFKIFKMKESYVKALGYGLSVPLNSFTVPLPALGWSCFGSWEFFNKILRKGYCLAHVAENSKSLSHEYKIHNWNEGFFLNAVNG
jgi:4'-phosphopantetheinyl transferase